MDYLHPITNNLVHSSVEMKLNDLVQKIEMFKTSTGEVVHRGHSDGVVTHLPPTPDI